MSKRQPSASDLEMMAAFEETEARKGEGAGKLVDVRFAEDFRHIFQFEIQAEELDEIGDAADAAGVEIDDFIREAALARARAAHTEAGPRKAQSPARRRASKVTAQGR